MPEGNDRSGHMKDAPEQPILDAASVLLVDGAGGTPRLLMGRRQADNAFLPGKWVFPGGRLEPSDHRARALSPLAPEDAEVLARAPGASGPGTTIANALAIAAVRELFEETGLALAHAAEPDDMLDDMWPAFRTMRVRPALATLRLLARAITPPGRPRRYDTRFFLASLEDVLEHRGGDDGEFSATGWFTFEEARSLDLPIITRRILADLETALAAPLNTGQTAARAIPFYYQADDGYRRDLLTAVSGPNCA